MLRPTLEFRELEPRIAFDGALIATGAEGAFESLQSEPTPPDATVHDGDGATASDASVPPATGAAHSTSPGAQIVFVDSSLSDFQSYLPPNSETMEVILLDGNRDGIAQMADILADRSEIDAIHIVSHGAEAELHLGTANLTLTSMQARYADSLSVIGDALREDGDILIYGCDFGGGEDGQAAVDRLAALTGADVAASDDATGSDVLGGDWQLERATGTVETASLVAQAGTVGDWQGLLDITTGLAAHYTFDEGSGTTAADSSGNGNDGTLIGSPTWVAGQVGSGALNFDQDFDRVDVPDNAATDFGAGDFSVGFWLNATDTSAGQYRLIGDGNGVSSGFIIYRDGADLTATISGSGGTAQVTQSGLFDGNWHHVVLVREGNLFSFYANGALVDTDTVAVGDVSTSNSLRIGASSASSNEYDGLIDEVRLYDRGLTSGDVGELFVDGGGTPSYPSSSGDDNSFEWITNVTFAGINNTSAADAGGYGDYTAQSANVVAGTSNNLSVTIDPDSADYITAWVDWNQDLDFDDPGEEFVVATNTGSAGPHTVSVAAPADAAVGDTRMRVSLVYNQTPTPTGTFSFGEVEDYTVSVAAANAAPVITSNGGGASANVNVSENTTAVTTVAATDADVSDTLTYAIVGGADAGLFSINGSTGALTFAAAPSFEEPGDTGTDNVYDVTVQVSDGNGGTDTQAIAVTVTDVNEAPSGLTFAQYAGGSEFVVNSQFTGDQTRPTVAALDNGGFVVAWQSAAQDGSGDGVYFQVYDAAGNAVGAETRANTTTFDDQNDPEIAVLQNGNFVIVWEGDQQDGSLTGSFGRIFDATGVAQSGEFQINTTTADTQGDPKVAALGGGDFVVVWESNLQDGDGKGIYSQRFDATGGALGSETQVHTTTAAGQFDPSVTALDDGGYIVLWDSAATGSTDVMARRFDAAGTAVTGEFQINTTTSDTQNDARAVALTGGGFVVIWESDAQDGSGNGVFARQYNAAGTAVSGEIQVNTTTAGDQTDPRVAALADGGFIVTWASTGEDGSGFAVFGQEFDAAAAKVNDQFQISVTTANDQEEPAVDVLQDGRIVVVYESDLQDGSGDGVVGRILSPSVNEHAPDGTTVSNLVQAIDPDAGDSITYSLVDDAGGRFAINPVSGEITVADGSLLDYETATSHSITVRATDGDGLTYDKVLTIDVNNIGGEPSQSLPGAQSVNEDATLTFSSGNGNAITVSDTDGADRLLEVTLTSTNGTMSLSQLTGLTIVEGADDSSHMVVQGSESDLNAALEGLVFTPTGDFNGSASINVTTTQAADLVGRYTFETGTADDDSAGTEQDGTLVGNAATTTDAERGEVLSLDGSGDYVLINDLFGEPTSVTLAAWVNYSTPVGNGGEIITIANNLAIRVDNWGNGITAFFWDGSSFRFLESGISFAGDGNWHHVAFSVDDAADTQSLYIDGELAVTASYSGSVTYENWTPQTTIGTHADLGDGNYDFNGLIDDARIYSRALSGDEIAALVADQISVTGSIAVTVNSVNDDPVITSDGGGAIANLNVAENTTAVTTVTSSDVDGGTPSYAIVGGADAGLFNINSSTGALTFAAAPDFETPGDTGADNVYDVTVEVSDGNGGSDTQAIAVTVTDANEAPTDITPNGFAINENVDTTGGVSLGSLAASDPDAGETFTYTIVPGGDGALFSIGGAGSDELILDDGVLDHETKPSYAVTVRVTDGGSLTYDETLTVTVNDLNETPGFTSGALTTATEGVLYSYAITTADPDAGDSLTITAPTLPAWLTLVDNGDGTATLSGTPSDAEVGVHNVVLQVADLGALSDTQPFTITVSNTNDAPVITSDGGGAIANLNVAENTTAVTTVTSSDVDGGTPSYAIVGGADAGLFNINSSTGALTFAAAPDFETPGDSGADNVYDVTVEVSDGNGGSDTQAIAVTVTDANEAPTDITPNGFAINENVDTTGGVSLGSLAASDPDAGETFTYTIVPGGDGALFSIGGAGSDELILDDGVLDHETKPSYAVTVRVTDGGSLTYDETLTVTVNDLNETPGFTSGALTTATEGVLYSYAITTADPDAGDSLTITAPTLPAWLTLVDNGDGTATLSGTPSDAEVGVHNVVLQVADLGALSDTQPFTITVSNTNDAPVITSDGGGAIANLNVAENTTAVTTVTSSDVDGGTPSYAIVGGADAGLFNINSSTGALTFAAAPDFETPGDTGADNVYDVTVEVSDGNGGSDTQAIAVTVTDSDEFDVGAIADTDVAADGVAENAANATAVGITAFASDGDGTNNTIAYSLDDDAGGRFTIDPVSGVVSVANGLLLDREAAGFHAITVRATSTDGSFSTQGFVVNLTDVDEFNVGAIADTDASADSTAENAASGTVVGIAAFASDPDATNSAVSYSLDDDAAGRFTIDAATGLVRVADGTLLDREMAADHDIVVRATSADGSFSVRTFTVDLTDVDEFDVGAIADSDGLADGVDEGAANGTVVGISASASDGDATNNAISYALDDDAGGRFAIDAASGIVRVANGLLLDRETASFHTVMIRATSTDGSFSTQDFMIVLADVDEFDVSAPIDLDAAQNSVTTGAANGSATGLVAAASDGDATTNAITYSLDDDAGGRFAIDAATGAVQVADGSLLDGDIDPTHTIIVRATSADGSFSSTAFAINVTAPAGAAPPPPANGPPPPTDGESEGDGDDGATGASDTPLPDSPPAEDADTEPTASDDAVTAGEIVPAAPSVPGTPAGAPAAPPKPDAGPAAAAPATDPKPIDKTSILEQAVDRVVGGLIELGLPEINRNALFQALDRSFSEMKLSEDKWNQLKLQVSVGSSVALTTGFVAWVLRGGALASALLATLPAWRGFDPLPVILNNRDEEADAEKSDIDEIFDRVAAAVAYAEVDRK